jgi:DNA polymerase I-like protein with 3'-5' exonuclease and polymerase domains
MPQRFDDPGLFYVPEIYKKKERAERSAPAPRAPPPIPETGWVARAEFPTLRGARAIAIDTETYDPDLKSKGPGPRRGGYIVGVSVAVDGWSRYYPIAHSMGGNLDKKTVLSWLKEQLAGPELKVGANLLYDLDFLHYEGIKVGGRFYDVTYADPLIYEYHPSYSLESIMQRRLGRGKETPLLYKWLSEAYGGHEDASQRANIWRAPVQLVGPYAESDAWGPLETMRAQIPELRKRDQIDIAKMEMGLIPLLLEMRIRGVPINVKRCQILDDELTVGAKEIAEQLKINVYAADEIAALCDKEGIKYPRTPTGKPSFVKDWLKRHPHPKMQLITKLRTLYKMRDTFVRGTLLGCHINGRVHCELHPMKSDEYGTVSGRFSSANPNLQQVPNRDPEWGPKIRSAFCAEDDDLWNKDDLSQIEFRLGIHFGVDSKRNGNLESIREQYRADHTLSFYKVAQAMTGLEYIESKSLSLGSLYGMGKDKFALTTHRSLEEAAPIYEEFHRKLSFMRDTYEHWAKYAEGTRSNDEDGWVRTIGGRLCHLQPDYEHKALNRKLQGSCADWIKRTMLEAYQAGIFDVNPLLLTVHDELDSSVRRTKIGAEACVELQRILVNAYPICIPVLAGIDLGPSWGELEEFEPEAVSKRLLETP